MKYGHIIQAVYGSPWAIRPDVLAVMVDMLHFRIEGGRLSPDEIEARLEAAGPRQRQAAVAGPGVALLELHGIIAPRAQMLADTSAGGTGLDRFMAQFRTAMADPEIGSIVISVDSPGGQVGGVPEAAAEIRAARDQKPVTAVANGMAASAAYWLGSQASEFVVTPSGSVGSIGVYTAHDDMSKFYDQKGIATTLISAGKYKTEGSDLGPLTPEARDYAQSVVDDFYAMFVGDVAKGRNVSAADVRSGYGEGRMLLAKQAKAAGMVDRIDTFDGVIRRELARPRMARPVAALGADWQSIAGPIDHEPEPDGVLAGPIGRHKTATDDGPWDGPMMDARCPAQAGPLRASHAWVENGADPNAKSSYRFGHHMIAMGGQVGAANMTACSSGIAVLNGGRGGTTIPAGDRSGVHAHLAGHLQDGGKEAPALKSEEQVRRFAAELAVRQHRVAVSAE